MSIEEEKKTRFKYEEKIVAKTLAALAFLVDTSTHFVVDSSVDYQDFHFADVLRLEYIAESK